MADILATSDQIVLRRFHETDVDSFVAYRSDPEVALYQGWSQMTGQEAAGFIAAVGREELFQPGRWSQIAIARADTGRLIGDLGIRVEPDTSAAEIGITLSRAAQGKGLGFAAIRLGVALVFDRTPVARIWAITDARNARSLALIHRYGFGFSHTETDTTQDPPLVEHFFSMARPGG